MYLKRQFNSITPTPCNVNSMFTWWKNRIILFISIEKTVQLKSFLECPDGMSCTNTIEGHYRQFSHYALALARSTNNKELTGSIGKSFMHY